LPRRPVGPPRLRSGASCPWNGNSPILNEVVRPPGRDPAL